MCNQNQSISISVIFRQNTKAIALLFAQIGSFSPLFNLQSKSINFNLGHLSPKYQGYSLTFCPKLPHFHHFSICNQNQSISILVNFRQNTKAIALLFAQNWLIFITFQCAIKINQFQFGLFFAKNTKAIALLFAQHCSFSSLFNVQSKSINFNLRHVSPKYQGYSLTFCPKLAHFHHFSIFNQNQSISIWVIFRQNTKAIALLFAQHWLIFITFQCAIKSINLNLVIFRQNTKAIALLFAQNWLIFISFQCAIKINQFQFRSFVAKIPRL